MSEVAVAPAQYKESGVQWLGKIPAHWEVKRIKDLSELQSGETITSQQLTDEGYPVYGGNGKRGYFSRYNLQGEYILIGRQGALCGNINYASGKFWASEHAVVVYKDKAVNTVWYGELLRIMNLNQYSLAAAQPGLSVDKIKRLELPFAPAAEQEAIADYILDHTAAIDRKIDLLGQKIKLYQTLRKTLINETVCRGLHPHAPRKDSGIEWIGEIPAHWQVKRFKSFASSVKGKAAEGFDEQLPGTLPVLSLDYLRNETSSSTTYLAPTNKATLVTPNDYIIIWDGAGVGEMLKGKMGILSSTIAKLVFDKKVMHADFCYFLRAAIEHITKGIPAGMGIPHLNPVVLNTFPCPCPPLEEQSLIIDFLKKKTSKLDTITTNLTTQIATLKELRKTLINDVVTGKLNVTA